MAFSGIDDLVSEIAAGKFQRLTANRIVNTGAASAAGRWHEAFAVSNGTGGIGVLTGTAGAGVVRDASNAGALPISPVNVTTDTRHLLSMMALTPAATMVPGVVKLIDILYVYPSCVVTTGAGTTLNNTVPRPTRIGSGEGVKAACIVAGTAIGAASPVITTSYTNQAGTTGRAGSFAASANSQPIGSLLTGAAVAVQSGPDMLMAAGDTGIQKIDSYTTASGTTGTVSFILYRDIAEVPIVAANTAGERDFLSQMPSLPKIDDNACLAFLVNSGGALVANSALITTLQLGWG
jgi:hypothetical protein